MGITKLSGANEHKLTLKCCLSEVWGSSFVVLSQKNSKKWQCEGPTVIFVEERNSKPN